jgi:hypothetical protein
VLRPSWCEDATRKNAADRAIKKAKFACTEDRFVLLHRTNDAGLKSLLPAPRSSLATHCPLLPRAPRLYFGGCP